MKRSVVGGRWSVVGPEKENNLEEGRFVCMRRANDISQEGDFIPAPEVGGRWSVKR